MSPGRFQPQEYSICKSMNLAKSLKKFIFSFSAKIPRCFYSEKQIISMFLFLNSLQRILSKTSLFFSAIKSIIKAVFLVLKEINTGSSLIKSVLNPILEVLLSVLYIVLISDSSPIKFNQCFFGNYNS
jgi:hypothetical protein